MVKYSTVYVSLSCTLSAGASWLQRDYKKLLFISVSISGAILPPLESCHFHSLYTHTLLSHAIVFSLFPCFTCVTHPCCTQQWQLYRMLFIHHGGIKESWESLAKQRRRTRGSTFTMWEALTAWALRLFKHYYITAGHYALALNGATRSPASFCIQNALLREKK